MTRSTIAHDLTGAEARRLLGPRVSSYAREYGLSSRWRDAAAWIGQRKGVEIRASLGDGRIVIEVETAWYIPVKESRIIAGIRSELKALLRKLRKRR